MTAAQPGPEQPGTEVHPSVQAMSREALEIGWTQAFGGLFRAHARIDELEASLRIVEYRARRAEDERDAALAALAAPTDEQQPAPKASGETGAE